MRNVKAELDYGKIWSRVKSAMSCKVDKVRGKGLSTNDYTTEDKEKVSKLYSISNNEIDELFRKEWYNGLS